jgi:vancomycin resistance protein YoaR
LIETSVFPANNSLQFRFYSTNPGRRIEIDQPIIRDVVPAKETLYEVNPNFTLGQIEQVDYAAEGADITVYRRIYDLGGNLVKEDSIYTHYLPWQAVYDVAPGDSRLR